MEIAELYLGNIAENKAMKNSLELARQSGELLETYIPDSDRRKGRILRRSTNGTEIGIIKSRNLILQEGDIFKTATGNLVLIHLEAEELMVLSFNESINSNSALDLVRLGHILGNQHYPIKIQDNKIYVRLITEAKTIQNLIQEIKIPGLEINLQTQSIEVN